jgi:hypothetical protein
MIGVRQDLFDLFESREQQEITDNLAASLSEGNSLLARFHSDLYGNFLRG